MIGSPNLTNTSEQQMATAPGMAFWADTGPFGKTCADCVFKGYPYVERNHQGLIVRQSQSGGCRKFHQLTGVHGPAFCDRMHARKYFQARATT